MIVVEPVAFVRSDRSDMSDRDWDRAGTRIELAAGMPDESLDGIDAFSHAEILFHFHKADAASVVTGARHPRDDRQYPRVGIFAQRGRARPNLLGLTIVTIVSREGRSVHVRGMDAVDGTPVLDIKPVMMEFLPRGAIRQPDWASALMRGYWQADPAAGG